jgi:site-specific DNA recombinase
MTTANGQRIAAIYARVSSEDQVKGYSIPTQIDACQRLAQQEGYSVPASHIFVDEGISGTTLDRPALRRVRDLVGAHAIAALIILDPDRLSRKMGKLLVLTDELQAANIPLLCVSHPVEYGPEGMLFFQMRGVIAEYEREKALERMQRGRIGRVKAGFPSGGAVPLGYRYIAEPHKGRLEIIKKDAAIVRRIFSLYLEGMSMRTLAHQLTQERIPTAAARKRPKGEPQSGGKWSVSSVACILRNETYAGTMYWNKRQRFAKTLDRRRDRSEWLAIPVPAIISQQVFDAAQQQSERNRLQSPRNRKHEYLFVSGRLRCGRCGASMIGYSSRRIARYRCASQFTHHPQEPFCRGGTRAEAVEVPAWQAVARVLSDPAIVLAELERQEQQGAAAQQDLTKERQAVQKALAALEREAQRWDAAYAGEVIDLDALKAKKLDIAERTQRLLAQQAAAEAALQSAQQAHARKREILTYCQRITAQLSTLDMPHKRVALEALDIRVWWEPGSRSASRAAFPLVLLRPLHRVVMDNDEVSVTRQVHIQLDMLHSHLQRQVKGG